jgi:hypothetical protein
MPLDFDASQGVVLREIIATAPSPVTVAPFNRHGRLDAFVFDSDVGVFIKYSTKRVTPWPFTFHIDQVSELLDLEVEHSTSFVAFVCGVDGIATIPMATLHELVTFRESEQAWIRVERKPRTLYSLSGNRGVLPNKVAKGVDPIIQALKGLRGI